MPTLRVKAPPLHPSQDSVRLHPARFKVLACGRRWGKTRLGSIMALDVALKGGRVWWTSPSYKMANVGWRLITRLSLQIPGININKSERIVTFPNGGEIAVRSADNPDTLRGEGLDLVIMDECAFMRESAWTEALRPALADRKGRAIFISTPKGRNWFWRLFQAGLAGDNDTMSLQLPTTDNPFIDDSEIEAARLTLPEIIFRQEFLAEFIEEAGLFRLVLDAVHHDEPLTVGVSGRQYVAGVDVASQVDFTVVSVMDASSKQMVYMDRFNRVEYPVLEERLAAVYGRFKLSSMVIESNSIGRPVIDHMRQRGLSIQEFTTTKATKTAVIQRLQSAFEHGEIGILNDPILIGELQAYEGKQMSGYWQYGAPSGMHDDCVMSLAIVWDAIGAVTHMPKNQPLENNKWTATGNKPGKWRM